MGSWEVGLNYPPGRRAPKKMFPSSFRWERVGVRVIQILTPSPLSPPARGGDHEKHNSMNRSGQVPSLFLVYSMRPPASMMPMTDAGSGKNLKTRPPEMILPPAKSMSTSSPVRSASDASAHWRTASPRLME